jgi:outer membrane protein TolC
MVFVRLQAAATLCAIPVLAMAQEQALSWNTFSQVFNERYQSRSPSRMKGEASTYRAVVTPGFRINPVIQGTWQKNSQEAGVSQSFPWGSSITSSFSQATGSSSGHSTERTKTYSTTFRQEILKNGLWNGFAQISSHSLNDELISLTAEREYQNEFMHAINAFLDVQLQAQRTSLALDVLERSRKEVSSIERDIASGYKAKTDLLVFLLAKNRSTIALQTSQNTYSQALRNLDQKLWLRDGDPQLKVDPVQAPPQALILKLESLVWPEPSPSVRVAQISSALAKYAAATASRDNLPSLGLWHTWKKQDDSLTSDSGVSQGATLSASSAGVQKTYGLEFSMPLTSAIYREEAKAAKLEMSAAREQLIQEVLADKHRKQATADDIAALLQQVKLAEENVALATQSQLVEGQKYRDGRSTIQEFRRSQAELAEVENALADARTNLIKRRIQFAVDIGALRNVMSEINK